MTKKKYLFWEDETKQVVDISKNEHINAYLNQTQNNIPLFNLPATWIEINLSQLKLNLDFVRNQIGNGVGIIGVLKSDAYGHGIVPLAKTLEKSIIEKIGVGSIEELIVLRKNDVVIPILTLYPCLPNQLRTVVDFDAEITVVDLQSSEQINLLAKESGKQIKIHIQVETGLNRFGVNPSNIVNLVKEINDLSNVSIEGICTHFANPDSEVFTQKQFDIFLNVLKNLADNDLYVPTIHVSNSGAIMLFPKSFDTKSYQKIMPDSKIYVRSGGLLYGTYATRGKYSTPFVFSSMVSHVADVSTLRKGEYVGYFQKYLADKNITSATVPVGWGNNGYLPNNAQAGLNGKLIDGIGLISSNNMALDCTDISCKVGDRISLIDHAYSQLTLENLAVKSDMFVNRLLSILGSKNRRVYFEYM